MTAPTIQRRALKTRTLATSGTGGNGEPTLADAQDLQRVIAQVTNGGGGMPSFRDALSTQEIRDVFTYVAQRIARGG